MLRQGRPEGGPAAVTVQMSVHYVRHVITGRAPGPVIRPSARL